MNPADPGSRGLLPQEFIGNRLWFQGPTWLCEDESEWPVRILSEANDIESEQITSEQARTCLKLELVERFSLFVNCSNYWRMIRSMVYVLRFINRTRKRHSESGKTLKVNELTAARMALVKLVQKECFADVEKAILRKERCRKEIQNLSPFIDDSGVIRVGGRLRNADMEYDRKFPILLPGKHPFTTMLIQDTHRVLNHASPKLLSSQLSLQYWILSSRRVIRHVLSKCTDCFRFKPIGVNPMMGNLPKDRVTPGKPFLKCGVDMGGPFRITLGRRRGQKTQKAYICLFVCFATEAIHLEVTTELSTEKFLDALSRFIARRGRIQEIYSDCGTNFVGASRYLTEVQEAMSSQEFHNEIEDTLARKGIIWHVNPPAAPHFGGLWEAGIKSTKKLLSRVIRDQILTYGEFNTLLTQVEAMLNSRPMYSESADPCDLRALTPGHFLTMEPPISLPVEDLTKEPSNILKHWQLVQQMSQSFWRRWSLDYLNTLQQRSKWQDHSQELEVGSLVIVNEDPMPPTEWLLGRVVELFPGADNVSRVAKVKTNKGLITRPVVKLAKGRYRVGKCDAF